MKNIGTCGYLGFSQNLKLEWVFCKWVNHYSSSGYKNFTITVQQVLGKFVNLLVADYFLKVIFFVGHLIE